MLLLFPLSTHQQASFLMDFLWLAVRSWRRQASALQLMMICGTTMRDGGGGGGEQSVGATQVDSRAATAQATRMKETRHVAAC